MSIGYLDNIASLKIQLSVPVANSANSAIRQKTANFRVPIAFGGQVAEMAICAKITELQI